MNDFSFNESAEPRMVQERDPGDSRFSDGDRGGERNWRDSVGVERQDYRKAERQDGDRGHLRDDSTRESDARDDIRAAIEEVEDRGGMDHSKSDEKRAEERLERRLEKRKRPELRQAEAEERETEESEQQETAPGRQENFSVNTAPSGWSKEAKEMWANLPELARQQIVKREGDMARGVEKLKAEHKELNDVFVPYDRVIQEFGKTRASATKQLWDWFMALGRNPDAAFNALVKSYRYDPRRLIESFYPGAIAEFEYMKHELQRMKGQQGYQQWRNQASQHYGNDRNTRQQYQQQYQQAVQQGVQQHLDPYIQQAKADHERATSEYLTNWASDKPHFSRVRTKMAYLLQPDAQTGEAAIPLTADNKVDLDEAYLQACWGDPKIRKQMIAAEARAEAAKRQAIQNARNAGSSISSSAPGSMVGRPANNKPTGKTARESILEAIDAHRNQ